MVKLASKEDYMVLARKVCNPILSYYRSNDSGVHLPSGICPVYGYKTADLESFSRPLWALTGIVKEEDPEIGKTIISMIQNGVDEKGELFWGRAENYDQMIVEMPGIAFFVFENIQLVKDTMDNESIESLKKWLTQINTLSYYENNWQFFGILINAILLNLGWGGSRKVISRNWKRLNKHYLGNGWYSDGKTKQRDYYIAFAYHFYSLLWVYIDKEIDVVIKKQIMERAEAFALSYRLFFDFDGASVPYGRSLIYRFATVSFWAAYKLVGLNNVPDEEVKYIISKNLDWWMKQDIFAADGTLNVGYAYNNSLMTENYNAAGSPYWAFKVFVLLLLPKENAFWSAIPYREEIEKGVKYIDMADLFVSSSNGSLLMYPLNQHASWDWGNGISKYEKYVYSSGHGFCVAQGSGTIEEAGCDSSLAVSYDNSHWIVKHNTIDTKENGNVYCSVWNIDLKTQIYTKICIFNGWHVRVHTIKSKRELAVIDCGFSIPTSKLTEYEKDKGLYLQDKGKGLLSIAIPIKGSEVVKSYFASPNSNILFPRVRVPYVLIDSKPGKHVFIDGFYGGTKMPDSCPIINSDANIVRIKVGKEEIEVLKNC